MTGQMPRDRAASRLALLSYPLSPTTARGVMSGPRSSRIEKCRLSLACPGVRSKAIGRPPKSVLRWILVEKPPRERPNIALEGVSDHGRLALRRCRLLAGTGEVNE